MKNAGWLVAFVLLIAVLVMWSGHCNDPRGGDGYKIDSLTGEVLRAEDELRLKEETAKLEIAIRDSVIAKTKQDKEKTATELHKSLTKIAVLRGQLGAAKGVKDTVEILSNCDSLAEFVGELTWLVYDYEKFADSVINMYEAQVAAKDSLLIGRERMYATLRRSYTVVAEDYGRLQTQYNKQLKKNKNAKLFNKILGGAVIVLGGIIISK